MIDFLILVLMSIAEGRWDKRTFMTRNNPPQKYFTRWYLLGGPQTEGMEDGDKPAGWGLYLHCFHNSDDDLEMHSHPWKWAVSLVLKNGYVEQRTTRGAGKISEWMNLPKAIWTHACRPGQFNWLTDKTFHRVDLDRGEAWTLFLVGPKSQDWGFLDTRTWKYTDWRTFFARKEKEGKSS